MFSWFSQWNRDNPTNVERPAIVVGVIGAAVIVATALVTLGQPFATKSLQTGPRGTGMFLTKHVGNITTPDPTIADIIDDPPYVPTGDEALAKDVYKNVQVLGNLTEDNFNRVMGAFARWVAPEKGCAFCHGDGDMETYGEDTLYTKVVARRMIQMTQNINENWDGHVNAYNEVGVTCYTCHRGQNVPSGTWFQETPTVMAAQGWAAVQNRATPLSSYTSLPSDALQKYLIEGDTIGISDQDSRVAGIPGKDGYPGIQNAERTFALMNYIDNSLGVDCVFCHNTRAFYDGGQVTPQWAVASLGIAMVQELDNEYLLPLKDKFPASQLGPHGDGPKLACMTCHKGYQQPMQGTDVIHQWPELATSGPPDYSAFKSQ